MVRVEYVLDSWRKVREDTVAAIEEFPAGEFDFRPVAEVSTFGELGRHILNAGHGMTGLLLTGEVQFATPDFRERLGRHVYPLAPGAGPAELAAALRDSIRQRTEALAAQPPEFFATMMTHMDGHPLTRLEFLQILKEHEVTHRAQLFLYLRMKGMVPPTTRRRMAKANAR